MAEDYERFVRIPVQFEDGRWMTLLGEPLTALPGYRAEFVVAERDLAGVLGAKPSPAPLCKTFLSVGTKLLVGLNIADPGRIGAERMAHVHKPSQAKWKINWNYKYARLSPESFFFELALGVPTADQLKSLPEFAGGLLVLQDVGRPVRLEVSAINLPDGLAPRQPRSLNQFLTLLSEAYEVHRVSHTGNIFHRVFYQEKNEEWYPLVYFRDHFAEAMENSFAAQFWRSAGRSNVIASQGQSAAVAGR